MKLGPVFSPVHQGHQELIRSTQFWRSAEITEALFNHFQQQIKGFALDARQAFEICIFEVFDCFVSYVPIMTHLCKRSNTLLHGP